jgi:hypothetical protein
VPQAPLAQPDAGFSDLDSLAESAAAAGFEEFEEEDE